MPIPASTAPLRTGSGAELPPASRRIAAMLEHRSTRFGDKPLLVIGERSYSCQDVVRRTGETAALLKATGIRPGDRVGILCGNRIELIDMLLGCAWLNAIAVPINRSSRGPQLQHILHDSGAKLLVIDDDAVDILDHVDPAPLPLEAIWLLPTGQPARTGNAAWQTDPMPPRPASIAAAPSKPSDTMAILYTSGTTGPSKGVCCPQAQMFWWGAHSIDILEIDAEDVLHTSLPLFHVNALASFFSALLAGATLVVAERFSASGFVESIRRHGATITYLLGAMVPILLSRPPGEEDRQHKARRALAPGVPASFGEAFSARFGIGLVEGYGSTETNFVIGDRLADQKPGTMGRVRPGFEASVVDPDDNELPPGTAGELVVRSAIPHAMASGYFNMPEATIESRRNLWFHTGDRVYRDEDGYFTFMDRMKDAIRRRGENISAYEVEQVLLSHPAVAQAAVYAVPSELAEDEVMAAIVCHAGQSLSPVELLDFCQPRMAYFSVPRFLLFRDALPMTDSGKVQRYRLRAEGVTADSWDREAAGYEVRRPRRSSAA